MDAALRVLESHGPDLPVEAVAAEAGVTKPVLYRYFADKAALIQALAERGSQMMRDRLLPTISADPPCLASINDGVNAYFAVIDEHPNLYWLLARHGHTADSGAADELRHNRDLIATALTSVIGDYLRAVGTDSGAAEPWAYGITGLVQSTGEWWLQRRSMSRARVVEYVTRLLWGAISGLLRDAGFDLPADASWPPLTQDPTDG